MQDGKSIDTLLAFLPAFDQGMFASSNSHYLATGDDLFEVKSLKQAIYDSGLVLRDFNWVEWKDEARRYTQELALINIADLEEIQRLLTISVRQDRFVGGLMSSLCSSGFLQTILYRLSILRQIATDG